jgi:molybdenum cofactor biosynthesis protein B
VNPIRLAIITVSDGVMAGSRTDASGAAIADWAERAGHVVAASETVPDESDRIAAALVRHADAGGVDLIVTTGGTGFTERDVTPEATAAVIERAAPGIAEAIRSRGAHVTPYAWLARGLAGIRGRTLIVNLPGSEGGVRDGLAVLDEVAGHAVQLLRGIDTSRHDPPADG